MTVTVKSSTVLAQHKRATEVITATYHEWDRSSYRYTVNIVGGKFHGVVFRCRTEQSTMWLFDTVVAVRALDIDWSWLTVGRESFDSEQGRYGEH
jgi:hypothetical protein